MNPAGICDITERIDNQSYNKFGPIELCLTSKQHTVSELDQVTLTPQAVQDTTAQWLESESSHVRCIIHNYIL